MAGSSSSATKGLSRDSGLEVIVEENEFFFTEVRDFTFAETPQTPQEGVFVEIDDVENFIVDCDDDKPRIPLVPALPSKKLSREPSSPPSLSFVSSDDDSYETDLDFDEEVWLNPDRCYDDLTGKSRYMKMCDDLGVTPISSFLDSLQKKKAISLRFYGLGVASAKAISAPLERNTMIEKLNLEGNGIEHEGAKFLARILKENLYITELVLTENKLGNVGAKAVCDLLVHNRCITKLDLSGNQIDDACCPYFEKVLLVNPALKHLRLAHNNFEELGARCFKEVLCENESLELLDLNWNHFSSRGSTMLAEGLQENVGLKCFSMAMAGLGCQGGQLVGEVLRHNRTLLELDVSYCRISADGIQYLAAGLRENDILQVLKIGSNPFDGDRAMILLEAIQENDSSALRQVDITHVFVKEEFVILAHKLQEQRGFTVQYEGVLPSLPKRKYTVEEMVRFRTDPVGHLRRTLQQCSMAPSEIFHLNGPSKITKQEFTDTVRMAQLDLSSEQINILYSKVQMNGLIDVENLLDCLENPQELSVSEA